MARQFPLSRGRWVKLTLSDERVLLLRRADADQGERGNPKRQRHGTAAAAAALRSRRPAPRQNSDASGRGRLTFYASP